MEGHVVPTVIYLFRHWAVSKGLVPVSLLFSFPPLLFPFCLLLSGSGWRAWTRLVKEAACNMSTKPILRTTGDAGYIDVRPHRDSALTILCLPCPNTIDVERTGLQWKASERLAICVKEERARARQRGSGRGGGRGRT